MTWVVTERSFEEAIDAAVLSAQERAVAWCLQEHRVQFRYSYLARDGRRMVCVYEAPDAEAVRITQLAGKLPFDAIWSAHHLPATPTPGHNDGYTLVIVQRDLPVALDVVSVQAAVELSRECLQRRKSAPVESFLSSDGRRMVCAMVAPDAESVRQATREADLPMTRAWPASRPDDG